eukprot:CAMPEP_0203866266 /NCGR_PEP_ID=MMETSP0359-20131031/15844_1 /ASSEMBLY_ACC=CAM_ASM_000338 /TAXON_ID=268821 /ORGANISM="Scrippsiella Hangoei, Strain SHTV-5" /LENGTH=151 /DNA_ID=CAMNT_0050784325 /DNA_START=67 /DNA_END=520 /DNA_ORIENTATION=+
MTAAAGLCTEVLAQLPVLSYSLAWFCFAPRSSDGLDTWLEPVAWEGRDAVRRSECAASTSSGRLLQPKGVAAHWLATQRLGPSARLNAVRSAPVGRSAAKLARAADDMAQTAVGVLACGRGSRPVQLGIGGVAVAALHSPPLQQQLQHQHT